MATDSRAVFEERCNEFSLAEFLAVFAGRGCVSFGTFAFATDQVPGAGNSDKFDADITIPGLGRADHPLRFALRR
eukprot:6641089-Heterocapsa_arctica.AAC.1